MAIRLKDKVKLGTGLNTPGPIDGLTLAGGITGGNYNISNINQISINDPGEGIVFLNGSSGTISLAIVDDSNDNILRLSGGNSTFEVQGTGTANAPTLAIDNSSSSTFNHSIEAFTGNMTDGENNIVVIGRAGSTKNSGYIGYKYSSAGSNANLLTFGHWGSDNLVNLTGDGKLGVGTQDPKALLHVNEGSLYVNKAQSSNAGDHNFIQLIYNGGWSQNTNGLAAINVTDGYPSGQTVGKFGVTYDGSQGKFVVTDMYNGGYAASGDRFTVRANGDTYINGRLGIGAAPTNTLSVHPDSDSEFHVYNSGTNATGIKAGSGQELYIGGNDTWAFRAQSNGNVTFDNGGSVGIGTGSPGGALHVYNGTSERFLITGDVHVQGSTDFNINGASRRINFTSGTGTIRTTTANNLILQTNSTTGLTLTSGNTIDTDWVIRGARGYYSGYGSQIDFHNWDGSASTFNWIKIGSVNSSNSSTQLHVEVNTAGDNNYPRGAVHHIRVHKYSTGLSISNHLVAGSAYNEDLKVQVDSNLDVWIKRNITWSHFGFIRPILIRGGATFNDTYTGANSKTSDPGGTPILGHNGAIRVDTSALGTVTHDYRRDYFRVDGSVQMTLNTTGLGLGTTSPSHKLHISGNGYGLNFSGGNNRIYFGSARALEGNGTSLQIGEGHTLTSLQASGAGTVAQITTNVASTGNAGLLIASGCRLGFDQSGTRSWTIKADNGNLTFYSGDGAGEMYLNYGFRTTKSKVTMVGGSSYNENIRMHAQSNNYSSLVLGAVSGDSGTGVGQWTLVRYPSPYKFSIRYNSTDMFAMDTSGNAHFDGDVIAYSTTTSDRKFKDNIITIGNALDKVSKLRGVEYDWNATSRKGERDLGVIAQEVQEVLPEIVREKTLMTGEFQRTETTALTVDYEKLTAVLIEAVKELKAEVDELKKQIK